MNGYFSGFLNAKTFPNRRYVNVVKVKLPALPGGAFWHVFVKEKRGFYIFPDRMFREYVLRKL
jgi:hypothetical protein